MATYTFQHNDGSSSGNWVFDGTVERDNTEDWSSIIAGNGTGIAFATYLAPGFQTNATSPEENWRGVMSIDTSAISDSETVTDAVLSIHGDFQQKSTNAPGTLICNQTSTASETDNSISDYENSGTTAWSNTRAYADYVDENWNAYTFNDTGESGINKTGKTKCCIKHTFDLSGTPTNENYQCFPMAGHATGGGGSAAEDPKLVVTTTAGGGATTIRHHLCSTGVGS